MSACWIKLKITGRSGPHYSYHLVDDEYLEDPAEAKAFVEEIAEDFARQEGIGQEYGFSWSFEKVDKLPDTVHAEFVRAQHGKIAYAQNMLKQLQGVATVPGCRHYGCNDVATQRVRKAIDLSLAKDRPNGPFTVDEETPVCDRCAKQNERQVQNVKDAAARWAAQAAKV